MTSGHQSWEKRRRRLIPYPAAMFLVCCFFSDIAATQTAPLDRERLDAALHRLEQGQIFAVDAYQFAKSGAVQAIPGLEKQFGLTGDAVLKDAGASALVRLGDRKDIYWDYLVGRAKSAIEAIVPFPLSFDASGHILKEQLSPKFVAWAQAHHVAPGDESANQIYVVPGPVLMLGNTGDPRGIQLLRRALSSPNYFIQRSGARGLAILGDKASIPLVIEACRKAPADMAESIALTLVVFDDQEATAAVEKFVSDPKRIELHRESFRKYGNDGLL